MPARSISVSLEESLLRELDQELSRLPDSSRLNRSAALAEALDLWLTQQKVKTLQHAYAQLQHLEGGDADAAAEAAVAMGEPSLNTPHG